MPRLYSVSFSQVLVAAAQDLFQVAGTAGKMLRIRRITISATDTTAPTAQMLSFSGVFLPATVTPGSGGTVPTPQKIDPGDANPSFTAAVNNTTPAGTSGAAATVYSGGCHIYNGLDERYAEAAEDIGPGEAYVFKLLSTVTGTVHLSGTIFVEEIGG